MTFRRETFAPPDASSTRVPGYLVIHRGVLVGSVRHQDGSWVAYHQGEPLAGSHRTRRAAGEQLLAECA